MMNLSRFELMILENTRPITTFSVWQRSLTIDPRDHRCNLDIKDIIEKNFYMIIKFKKKSTKIPQKIISKKIHFIKLIKSQIKTSV